MYKFKKYHNLHSLCAFFFFFYKTIHATDIPSPWGSLKRQPRSTPHDFEKRTLRTADFSEHNVLLAEPNVLSNDAS